MSHNYKTGRWELATVSVSEALPPLQQMPRFHWCGCSMRLRHVVNNHSFWFVRISCSSHHVPLITNLWDSLKSSNHLYSTSFLMEALGNEPLVSLMLSAVCADSLIFILLFSLSDSPHSLFLSSPAPHSVCPSNPSLFLSFWLLPSLHTVSPDAGHIERVRKFDDAFDPGKCGQRASTMGLARPVCVIGQWTSTTPTVQ